MSRAGIMHMARPWRLFFVVDRTALPRRRRRSRTPSSISLPRSSARLPRSSKRACGLNFHIMTNQNRSRFVRNAVANWIAFLFTAIVGFFLSPYIVEHLGASRYGVWSLLAGLVGYLGLLDLGIRQALNRYVAHHRAVHAHEESSSIVSAAIRLFGLLGILAILLSGVLAYFAPIFFNIPESLVDDTRLIVVLGGLTVAVTLIGGVFGGVVTGLERFDVSCFLEALVTTLRSVAIVLSLREGYGLVALACIHFAASVLNCVAFWAAVHKLYADLRLRFRCRMYPQIRTILS